MGLLWQMFTISIHREVKLALYARMWVPNSPNTSVFSALTTNFHPFWTFEPMGNVDELHSLAPPIIWSNITGIIVGKFIGFGLDFTD